MIKNYTTIQVSEIFKDDKYKDCVWNFRKPKTSELLSFNEAQIELQDINASRAVSKKPPLEATPNLAKAIEELIANSYISGTFIGDTGEVEELDKETFIECFLDIQTVTSILPLLINTEGLVNSEVKSEQD
jgi:hypothetical protein